MRYRAYLLAALLFAAGLPAAAAPDALAQITALGEQARRACERYSFAQARHLLEQALGLARAAGLDAKPPGARLYLLLGIAYTAGGDDTYRGVSYLARALRLDPKLALPATLATPQLVTVYEQARDVVKRVGTPPLITWVEEEKPDPLVVAAREGQGGVLHAPPATAKRGLPILLKAAAGLDVPAYRMFVYYRLPGTVPFTRLPMSKKSGVFQAAIPAPATRGRYIHYFIEALDQRGRTAGAAGSATSPIVVTIE